ncbi:hypothetical protein N7486_002807 [Penicillium sp. IBT 16267x]|nr:hypothetical protein N7486_002807 [Penicillium sp. IBT 16267x]
MAVPDGESAMDAQIREMRVQLEALRRKRQHIELQAQIAEEERLLQDAQNKLNATRASITAGEKRTQAVTPAPRDTSSMVAAFIESVVKPNAVDPTAVNGDAEKATPVNGVTKNGNRAQGGTIPPPGNLSQPPKPSSAKLLPRYEVWKQKVEQERALAAATAASKNVNGAVTAPNAASDPPANGLSEKRPSEGTDMSPAKIQKQNPPPPPPPLQVENPPPQPQISSASALSGAEKRLEQRLQQLPVQQPIGQIKAPAPPTGPRERSPPRHPRARSPSRPARGERFRSPPASHYSPQRRERSPPRAPRERAPPMAPRAHTPPPPKQNQHILLGSPVATVEKPPAPPVRTPPEPPVPTYEATDWQECRNFTCSVEAHFQKYPAFYCNDERKIEVGKLAIAAPLVDRWNSYSTQLSKATWLTFCTFLVELLPPAGGEEESRRIYSSIKQRPTQSVRDFVFHMLRYHKCWTGNNHNRLRHLWDRIVEPLKNHSDKSWMDFHDFHEFVEYLEGVEAVMKAQGIPFGAGVTKAPKPPRSKSAGPSKRGRGDRGRGDRGRGKRGGRG